MVLPAALKATAFLLPPIYQILLYEASFVSTALLLLLCACFELYPILKDTLLATMFAVVLAGVLVPSMQLSSDLVHSAELLAPFVRILIQVFVVRHTAAEGSCELIDDDINYCPISYCGLGIQSINLIEVVLH